MGSGQLARCRRISPCMTLLEHGAGRGASGWAPGRITTDTMVERFESGVGSSPILQWIRDWLCVRVFLCKPHARAYWRWLCAGRQT